MSSGLPQKMLADAEGIAFVPNVVRGALVVGVQPVEAYWWRAVPTVPGSHRR